MKNVFLFFGLLGSCAIAHSQDKDAEAKVHYLTAEESFNKGTLAGAEECTRELRDAEISLGTTNAKILYLKIKAEYKFYPYLYNEYALIISLKTFFKITDANTFPSDKYTEIVKISLDINYVKDPEFEKKILDPDFIKENKELAPDYQFTGDGNFTHGEAYYYESNAEGYSEALYYFKKAADSGNLEAMSNLSKMYYEGWGDEKNYEKALYWAFKANDSTQISFLIAYTTKYVTFSGQKVIDWAAPMSQGKNSTTSEAASFLIAKIYYEGIGGVEKDNFQALQWYIKAYSQTQNSERRMDIKDRIGTISYVNSSEKDIEEKKAISDVIAEWLKKENIVKLY
jgi:TPR repeat protein